MYQEIKDYPNYLQQEKDHQYRGIPLNTNILSKSKKAQQSEFRVHFYIRNVYNKETSPQNFVQNITNRIAKVARVHLVQISYFVDDNHVDVSVGLYRDIDAYKLLTSTDKKILLQSQTGQLKQCTIYPSTVFESYIKFHQLEGLNKQKKISEIDMVGDVKKQQNPYKSKKIQSSNEKLQVYNPQLKNYRSFEVKKEQNTQRERSRQKQMYRKIQTKQYIDHDKNQSVNQIWVFGVPMQYQKKEVQKQLQEQNIQVNKSQWKFLDQEEQIQFLLVQLKYAINQSRIDNLQLKISQYYPVLCLPKPNNSQEALKQLAKYQVQIKCRKQFYQEQQLIFYADSCGDVIAMVYTQTLDSNYFNVIIAFSNKKGVKKISSIDRDFREYSAQKPKEPLKIGRTYRQFTFQELIEGLRKINKQKKSKY